MFWKKKPKYQITYVTDDNFHELVESVDTPVLLDFYADWCGPCKVLSPIIEELAEEYDGRALIAKVNTETNPKLSQLFKIKSIPTMMMFTFGKMQEQFKGLIPKPNLEEIIDEYIEDYKEVTKRRAENPMPPM